MVGWPGASQRPAPSDPGVTVSRHRALLTSTSVRADPPPVGDDAESRRRESHPPALAEPGVNLSAHRAPIVPPSGRTPQRQCANRPGWRLATSAMNLRARPWWRRRRLYFRMAHLTSVSLRWRKTGYNMDL